MYRLGYTYRFSHRKRLESLALVGSISTTRKTRNPTGRDRESDESRVPVVKLLAIQTEWRQSRFHLDCEEQRRNRARTRPRSHPI